jgi:uncharacterized membrane protein
VRWVGTADPYSLGPSSSEAKAVNSDGTVIVGNGTSEPFIWDSINGTRALSAALKAAGASLSGWTLQLAEGISADGKTIVGTGLHSGKTEAWIARMP